MNTPDNQSNDLSEVKRHIEAAESNRPIDAAESNRPIVDGYQNVALIGLVAIAERMQQQIDQLLKGEPCTHPKNQNAAPVVADADTSGTQTPRTDAEVKRQADLNDPSIMHYSAGWPNLARTLELETLALQKRVEELTNDIFEDNETVKHLEEELFALRARNVELQKDRDDRASRLWKHVIATSGDPYTYTDMQDQVEQFKACNAELEKERDALKADKIAVLKLALELAKECFSVCNASTHREQITELKAMIAARTEGK